MNEVLLITLGMFLLLFFGMAWGLDLAFLLGAISVIFILWLWGPGGIGSVANAVFKYMANYTMVCLPLFIFMAFVLERSGVADSLYSAMYRWMGHLKGGLAMGTVGICTVFAAMSGTSGLAVATMGIIALPNMLKRGYSKHLVTGTIMAGAALGSLIPPSIIMIIYSLFSGQSIGSMFIGGIIPGIILSSMFIIYIGIRCALNPSLGPALPHGESFGFVEKIVSLKAIILPILLVLAILGSIFFGIATPTEASAIGALGAVISAAINRKLNWGVILEASTRTIGILCMVIWIIFGAASFAMTYQALGAPKLIAEIFGGLAVSRWVILLIMQLSFFLLGCILNNMAILMLTMPVYLPLVAILGFDPLWFGILYMINMEMALLTPPFGFTLFYMKAVVPPEITMTDLYKSVWPFVALQAVGLVLVMILPQLAVWLPRLMIHRIG